MNKNEKRDGVLLAIFLAAMVFMLILLAIFGKLPPSNDEIQDYFENYVQQHGELGTGTATSAGVPGEPKLFMMSVNEIADKSGNEVVLYQQETDVTGIPKKLRATYLDELNAIALIRSEIYETYYYTDGHKGYVMKYYVTIIDLATNSMIAEEDFRGTMPPGVKQKYEEDQYGPIPFTIIHDWINNLFVKDPPSAASSSAHQATDPSQNVELCWTAELSGFSGNRSQVWETVIPSQVRARIPYEQFLELVVERNPELANDGYEFLSSKIYLLPKECQ